ncbi:CRISPR-associated endonuclease Cas4g/Cas1g [Allorhodopirellula heiligendammensis]|uniref:CRISPR-associated endonuclease Cas1 n=1 Tax=Allorhodopirellula heiligendammensis TaxID=2714739 RepID=A0A5C6C1T4_9BACT|nr:CRISPR-associated endonuclease Cas1 [Allorhodopirellula heiligendammensis]TWU17947.1 CRISPR-associated protein Cas4/endonuclease Cas1 fusion [Allorhodopirellula heiligendammensis]
MIQPIEGAHSTTFSSDRDPEDLLPARMINELVYCPRLFYLMHVEGQFAESIDTIDGGIVHRRVDNGTGGLAPAEPCATQSFIPSADEDPAVIVPEATKPKKRRKSKHVQAATLFGDDDDDGSEAGEQEACEQQSDQDSDASEEAEDLPKTIHARSVTLSSESLGVIAKLDLAEATGSVVTPVDYKRGRPKRMADGTLAAWDPERVQIALQVLVLRDNGYQSDEGVLYFNETRQRVRVGVDEELLDLTRSAIAAARQHRESGQIPPPLVSSPKCPRCSLVGICLPEETRRLANIQQPPAAVRPLITARDERRPVYFNTQGMWIGKKDDLLQAKVEGKVVQEIRFNDINQINLFGNIQLSTQAIQTALGRDVPIGYFTQKGYYYGVSGGLGVKNILVRRQQFRLADDSEFCLDIARALVHGKIRNQRTLLMRNHREPDATSLRDLKRYAARALTADSLASLLGIEGIAARIYFGDFAGMLKVDCGVSTGGEGYVTAEKRPAFHFRSRNRRPPRDPVNAMLSLAYSLLTKDCLVAATIVGLDPHLGFYHQVKPGKPALALDLMEPFRPLIADSVVLSAINTKMVTADHFICAGKSVVMSDAGRKHFLLAYEKRMDSLVTHPLFDYRVSYRRLLEIQTRLLARRLSGEIEEYPVFQTR